MNELFYLTAVKGKKLNSYAHFVITGEEFKAFAEDGYAFNPNLSSENELYFHLWIITGDGHEFF